MYLICEDRHINELMKEVNEYLLKGYICQGGICSTSENEECSAKFYQAMVKTP
jgi:hypothetical protein